MTKQEYESQVQALVGHRLKDVRYHEILYTDDDGASRAEPEWNKDEEFDSLDHGVDLDFLDGSMCHVTWGAEFERYGLSIKWGPQRSVGTIRVWDVADGSRWQPLLGRGITAADVYWSWVQYQGDPNRIHYPQTLRLSFENGARVYLSAFEVRGYDFRMGCMDHITVFFDGTTAEEYGAWPPPDQQDGSC